MNSTFKKLLENILNLKIKLITKSMVLALILMLLILTGCAQSNNKRQYRPSRAKQLINNKYKNTYEGSALSTTSRDMQDIKNDLRILEFLPGLLCPLAVEPGVPADFIALSPKGNLDPYDWIYWGPKKVLQRYFKDPDSLQEPIIRVKLSANVVQTGPNSFHENFMKDMQRLKQEDSKFSSIELAWGDYPVLAIRTLYEGKLSFIAWVGLNDPEAGWTLMFDLVCPNKKGHPNKEDRQLWQNLLMKTTSLKDGDYFKAYGQDLQEGYTVVNIGGAKLRMIAEKRQSDGVLQVVIIPKHSDIEFHYVDMEEGAMGAEWKYGEPMVKVFGEIVINDRNGTFITNYVTSIFFKTVMEFSFNKEKEKELLIVQKACDQIEDYSFSHNEKIEKNIY